MQKRETDKGEAFICDGHPGRLTGICEFLLTGPG